KALPDPSVFADSATQTEIVKPQTELEEKLAQIVSDVLGVDRVGLHNTFFDLGGTSVDLVKIHASIRDRLASDIKVVDLFRRPTIALLADYLNQGDDDTSLSGIEEEAARRREGRMRRRSRRMPQVPAREPEE